jgi:outer membrane protein OmpA-like peptidoglycan-associated protein
MKKLFLIFSVFVCAALPAVAADTSEEKGAVGEFFSNVGSGVKSGFDKARDAVGLSSDDISARRDARAERRTERANEQAAATTIVAANPAAVGTTSDVSGGSTTSETTTAAASGGQSTDTAKLAELRDNATAANRASMIDGAITGVSTAAMGIGGMQLAQGLGEQSADRAVRTDMQGYLDSLYCSYGTNRVAFGTKGTQLTDAELDLLREEYAIKSAGLKDLKVQMGIKPGVESEIPVGNVMYDANGNIVGARLITDSDSLYNNDAVARGSSEFGRLSTALQDGAGIDAQMIAAQQQTSRNRVVGGAIAVASGAAVGIAGNILNEKFGEKDKSAKINAKYAGLAEQLRDMQNQQVIGTNEQSGEELDLVRVPTTAVSTIPATQTQPVQMQLRGGNLQDAEEEPVSQAILDEISKTQAEMLKQQNQIQTQTDNEVNAVIERNLCSPPRSCVGGRSVLGGTLFATNSSAISADGKRQVREIAEVFKVIQSDLPGQDLQVVVNGFTDNTGSDAVNNKLSQDRADAVRAELIAGGISSDMIVSAGMGKSSPVCPANNTPECRQQNRRVEIQVSAAE